MHYEPLENRRLLAVTVELKVTGRLEIIGDDLGNVINIFYENGTDVLAVDADGVVTRFDPDRVRRFDIQTNDGDDIVTVDSGIRAFVRTGEGDDFIRTAGGNDSLSGGSGNDTLAGGSGNDTIGGGFGNDIVLGQAGDDDLSFIGTPPDPGETDNNTMNGGSGIDLLRGVGSAGITVNLALGVATNDTETTQLIAIENVRGTVEDDSIIGDSGANRLESGSGGNDTIFGLGGPDTLLGDSGDDLLDGGSGDDEILGDSGNDTIFGAGGSDELDGESGDDSIEGGTGNDTLTGGFGDNVVLGQGGDDIFSVIGGSTAQTDVLDGGSEIQGDIVQFNTFNRVFASLDGIANDGRVDFGDTINLLNIENILGSSGADTLIGDGGPNLLDSRGGSGRHVLRGNGGDDTLLGSTASDDVLFGGTGNDVLRGFSGDDLFIADNDGQADSVEGGVGNDTATVGPEDILDSIENV
ncbi:MAG: calcium-binding protein [Planctomycetota bacterium]